METGVALQRQAKRIDHQIRGCAMAGIMSEDMFEHIAFNGSEKTASHEDRQKLPRIIKGSKILPQPLALERLSPVHAGHSSIEGNAISPRIRLLKKGAYVEGVEVQCSCGHTMKLAFDYERPLE
jgi:hypothetical protein